MLTRNLGLLAGSSFTRALVLAPLTSLTSLTSVSSVSSPGFRMKLRLMNVPRRYVNIYQETIHEHTPFGVNTRHVSIVSDKKIIVTEGKTINSNSSTNSNSTNINSKNKISKKSTEDSTNLFLQTILPELIKFAVAEWKENPQLRMYVRKAFSSIASKTRILINGDPNSPFKLISNGDGNGERDRVGIEAQVREENKNTPLDVIDVLSHVERIRALKSLNLPPTASHHDILQLDKTASYIQITRQFHKLAMKWHPDHSTHPDSRIVFDLIKSSARELRSLTN